MSLLEKGQKCRMREWTLQPVQELGPISLLLQRAASEPHQVTTRRTAHTVAWCCQRSRMKGNILWLQEVLRGEDRHLLRLAGILHWDAVLCSPHGCHMFHLWTAQLWRKRVKVSSARGRQRVADVITLHYFWLFLMYIIVIARTGSWRRIVI